MKTETDRYLLILLIADLIHRLERIDLSGLSDGKLKNIANHINDAIEIARE